MDAHSLHSPFFYNFYTTVVRPKRRVLPDASIIAYQVIENLRTQLLRDDREIDVVDLGAGSKHADSPRRKISEIARHSLTTKQHGALYHRAITFFGAEHVLELGTSLGIGTLYLALSEKARVISLEGSPSIVTEAISVFSKAGADNISITVGNIDDTLERSLANMPRVDFAFLDANHQYTPTCRYFETLQSKLHEGSIVVLDDIHDSAEMERAWNDIRRHPKVTGSADLFRCGFVFFDPSLNSQHFVLQT